MHANIVQPDKKYNTPAVQELKTLVEDKLRASFSDNLVSSAIDYDFPVFTVKREVVINVLDFLYNESSLQFKFLTTLAVTHFPDKKDAEFGVMYQLHNLVDNKRIRVKTFLPLSDPHVRTATTIFASANWQERQEYDFYGVVFDGHPNLKRILNMDEMNYHPLRKEFALEDGTREDKDNTMFGR